MVCLNTALVVFYHTAGVIRLFYHGDNFFAVNGHAACDNLSDVSCPEDHDALSDVQMIDVNHLLHLSGGIDPLRSAAADAE